MPYFAHATGMTRVIAGATQSTEVVLQNAFGRDLLILHKISGSPASGGRCAVTLSPDGGVTKFPHHGDQVGLPGVDTKTSYSAVAHDLSDGVVVALTVTDGSHDVWVQWLG